MPPLFIISSPHRGEDVNGGYIEYLVSLPSPYYEVEGRQQDELRTSELSNLGVQILRFSNLEILNIEGVCEMIQKTIEQKRVPPHLNPLPCGERK